MGSGIFVFFWGFFELTKVLKILEDSYKASRKSLKKQKQSNRLFVRGKVYC